MLFKKQLLPICDAETAAADFAEWLMKHCLSAPFADPGQTPSLLRLPAPP
jgi:hypothetical protein